MYEYGGSDKVVEFELSLERSVPLERSSCRLLNTMQSGNMKFYVKNLLKFLRH